MSGSLDRQLEAYFRLRPRLLEERREGWALIAHETLIDVFAEFDAAAVYADENLASEQVLIRHTSEHRGVAPFIVTVR